MKFSELLSVDGLENSFSELISLGQMQLNIPLSLPQPVPFCAEALLTQFLVTLSRKYPTDFAIKITNLDKNNSNYLEIFEKSLGNSFLLSAWIMSSKVLDVNGAQLNKSDAAVYVKYLDAIDSYDFLSVSEATRVNLVCVQGAIREFIHPLYQTVNGKPILRSYTEIRLLIQDILSQLSPEWTGKALRDVSAPMAQLVKELFENSDWWARTDSKGNLYRKGIRMLSFRLVNIDDDNAEKFGGGNTHVHSYLQTTLVSYGSADGGITSNKKIDQNKLTFVEVTITDSGPGLALRWLNSNSNISVISNLNAISLAEEEDAVIECFKKWATSSNSSLRGIGLFSVGKLLKEKNGFMRMRSGRLAFLCGTNSADKTVSAQIKGRLKNSGFDYLKLDDGTHAFSENGVVVFFLKPWSKSKLEAVEGTSYSIILPV